MKKTLLTLALVASAASSVFAQGFVLFNNTAAAGTKISTNNMATVGLATGAANTYYFALFYSTTATTVGGSTAAVSGSGNYVWTDSNWTFGGAYGSSSATAGRFASNSADPNNSGGTAITGLAGGSSAQFVVVGWTASIGTTIQALEAWYSNPATAGLIGESNVSGPITASSGGVNIVPALFGTGAGSIQGFTLAAVPEPTTVALIGLGGLGLAMIRRRK